MAYLTNGTLNYDLTKDAACCELQLAYIEDRNKMDPTYPDPNDSRFTDPVPVFTILNNLLYRDGVSIGKIYNNKTGKVVEITETTGTGFKYKDTEEDALINKDNSIVVVEKLTGLKGEVVIIEETKLVVYYDIQDISSPTTIFTNYDRSVKSIDIDSKETISEFSQGDVTYQFDSVGEHIIKFEFNNPATIGNSAPLFYNLTTAKRIIIPNTFTAIGSNAFNGCSGLTNLTIGDSVISVSDNAFLGCTSLSNISTNSNPIGFGNLDSLTDVIIGNSVTTINIDAFKNCRSLTNITIGNSVTSIGYQAFYECINLTNIEIPNSVTSIGYRAFYGCGLTSVTSLATTAPSIDSTAFLGIKTNGTLTVPSGSTGYDVWMGTGDYFLGKYNWTKVELS